MIFAIGSAAIVVAGGLVFFGRAHEKPKQVSSERGNTTGYSGAGQVEAKPESKPIEQIERLPDVFPGDSLDKVIGLYGRESEVTDRFYVWNRPHFILALAVEKPGRISEVSITFVKDLLVTPDGVVLGRDTLSQVKKRLGDQLLPDREELTDGEGAWQLTEQVQRRSGEAWKVTYRWSLNEAEESQRKILYRNGENPEPAAFSDVPVSGYTVSRR